MLVAYFVRADRRPVASAGIAEAVEVRKSIQKQKGDGGVPDKTGCEGRG
jgi:hypothetical protein